MKHFCKCILTLIWPAGFQLLLCCKPHSSFFRPKEGFALAQNLTLNITMIALTTWFLVINFIKWNTLKMTAAFQSIKLTLHIVFLSWDQSAGEVIWWVPAGQHDVKNSCLVWTTKLMSCWLWDAASVNHAFDGYFSLTHFLTSSNNKCYLSSMCIAFVSSRYVSYVICVLDWTSWSTWLFHAGYTYVLDQNRPQK